MLAPSPIRPEAVAVRDLHKHFGHLEVLRGVSLSAREGEVVAILGSSGSGKSTLLRCINLLEVPEAGEVVVGDEAVAWRARRGGRVPADTRQVDRIRARVGMVFQSFNLWSHRTVLENVIEAPVHVLGRNRADCIAEAEGLLAKVGIADKRDHYPPTSPAASSSAPPSPGRSPCTPASCSSTSRPPPSIPSASRRCCG